MIPGFTSTEKMVVDRACLLDQINEQSIGPVLDLLPLCTAPDHSLLDNSIYQFVHAHLPHVVQTDMHLLTVGETKGISGAPVYLIFTSNAIGNNHLEAVVKAFPTPKAHMEFVQELRALVTLNALQLKQSRCVSIIGVGKCTYGNNQQCALLLQSAAQGKGVDDWVESYLKGAASPQQIELIIKATAAAFAELHTNTQSPPPSQIKEYKDAINDMVPKVIPPENLNELHIKVLSLFQVLDEPLEGIGAIIHGDSHPGNIFAHIEDNACIITFIDTPSLDRSRNTHAGDGNRGHSPPERDFSNFIVRARDIFVRKQPFCFENSNFAMIEHYFQTEYPCDNLVDVHKDLQMVRSLLGTLCKCQAVINQLPLDSDSYQVEMYALGTTFTFLETVLQRYQPCMLPKSCEIENSLAC